MIFEKYKVYILYIGKNMFYLVPNKGNPWLQIIKL